MGIQMVIREDLGQDKTQGRQFLCEAAHTALKEQYVYANLGYSLC